jgi:NitT/TauT family transport system ATP-binding protein
MLDVSDLTLGYGREPVLEGANLRVEAGQFVSLVGPSGSGKSSLLRAIMGLQQPTSGTVTIDLDHSNVGMLFQDDALLPWRTAIDNVALGLRIRGKPWPHYRDTAEAWLGKLGLAGLEQRFPRALSGGQRKRVALAQVLALQPRLLLMDEPFAALDAIVRHRITQDLLDLVEGEKISVLLVTHDLEEALVLSDVVCSAKAHELVSENYSVPISRPRDIMKARTNPSFAPLLQRLWQDLSAEVDMMRRVA